MDKKKYIGTILVSGTVPLTAVNVGQQNSANANSLAEQLKSGFLSKVCKVPLVLLGLGFINGVIVAKQQKSNIVKHKYGGEENIKNTFDKQRHAVIRDDVKSYTARAFIYGLTFGLFGELTDFSGKYKEFNENYENSGQVDEKNKKDANDDLPFKHFGRFTVSSENVGKKEPRYVEDKKNPDNMQKLVYDDSSVEEIY